ncbi:MAG: peptidylprolyl isomerase, partial [Candidatus Hydrothermarchaeales archaeon]
MEKRIFLLIVVLIFFSGCSTSFLGEYNFSPVDIKSDSELTVKAGDTVKINYILSTADKQVLDTSFEEVAKNWELNLTHAIEPMTVKVGDGMIIPGLEEDLLGMKVGEQKEVLIPPERGYGPRNESLVRTFPRTSV